MAQRHNKYRFTASQDWYNHHASAWRDLFSLVAARTKTPRALELGCWEGRSAVFVLTELCGSSGTLVCVDHFGLLDNPSAKADFETVRHNLRMTGSGDRARMMIDYSVPALMQLIREELAVGESNGGEAGFDFLYINSSHEADDVLLDGELVWRLAREGAVVIFENYGWTRDPVQSKNHPKRGVDAFMQVHAGEFERLSGGGQYQMVLRKTSEMCIGFKVADNGVRQVEYGVNVAPGV